MLPEPNRKMEKGYNSKDIYDTKECNGLMHQIAFENIHDKSLEQFYICSSQVSGKENLYHSCNSFWGWWVFFFPILFIEAIKSYADSWCCFLWRYIPVVKNTRTEDLLLKHM